MKFNAVSSGVSWSTKEMEKIAGIDGREFQSAIGVLCHVSRLSNPMFPISERMDNGTIKQHSRETQVSALSRFQSAFVVC